MATQSDRRYTVTRAEVQALPQFVANKFDVVDDDEEIIIEEDSGNELLLKGTRQLSLANPQRTSPEYVDEDEEEEIIEEEYEEVIEEEDEILDDDPLTPSNKARKTPDTEESLASGPPQQHTSQADQSDARASPLVGDHEDHHEADEESLPDAEDVLEALKYILRQEKPVENGFITEDQEKQMLGLPLSEMVDIMKHFELCDNEHAPIRWDLVCLMIHAVDDDLSDEEVDGGDGDEGSGKSDDEQEALDEITSLGSGYDIEAKDDYCDSDLSEFNESGIINE
jgi:hypothetical protein